MDTAESHAEPVAEPSRPAAGWRSSLIVGAAALLVLAALTHRGVFMAGNDASRFAHIQALVEQGVPYIEGTRYAWTVDQVTIGGHSYSNKPPVLALAGAACYWVIHQVTGWSFADHSLALTWLLTLLLAGLPTAALAGVFDWWIRQAYRPPPLTRWLAVAALAGGTILTSYSTSLNNHTNAAAFLFFAFVCAWRKRFGWAGFWAGVTTWIDVLPGLCFIPVLLWHAWSAGGRRQAGRCFAALSACALAMFAANWVTVGSILLPKLVPGAVDRSSNFAGSVGGVLLPEHATYPLECLVGGHGFFTVSPVLVFGVAGLVLLWRRSQGRERTTLSLLLVAMALFTLGHICLAGSYGGWAYGFRYLIPLIPLICAALPPALPPGVRRYFAPVLAVSVLFALIGAYNPWPPAYEQEANKDPVASLVTNPVGGNAAAWLHEHAPGTTPAIWMEKLFVSPRPDEAARYFDYFRQSKGIR